MNSIKFIKKQSRQFLCFFTLLIYSLNAYNQCNGSISLCSKRYNEVAYLTTHNAFNSVEDSFLFPNQNFNIVAQLNDGVRALMVDVYDVAGTPTVYHGASFLGAAPLLDFLIAIKTFLDDNPNEIVSVILECYTTASKIEEDLNLTGLNNYLYSHSRGSVWPTLQTMIDAGKRLVIFTDRNDANSTQGWYHYVWEHAVETHFSANSLSDFSCDFNRGYLGNDLFILNHFITRPVLGTGNERKAFLANSNPFFH